MALTLTLEFWKDGEWYVGQLREVPGIFSQGRTLEELDENIRDAYHLMLRERPAVRRAGVRRKHIAIAV